MRVGLLSANARSGDAIGNQLAEKVLFFVDRGADVRVFIEDERNLHPSVQPYCTLLGQAERKSDACDFLAASDVVIADYSQYYGLLELLPVLAGGKPRLILDYHGVTPAEFWGTHNREALENGARQRGLIWCADAAIVHSQCIRREILDYTGFPTERLHCLGYAINTDRFQPAPAIHDLRTELGLGDVRMLLFVGRLAPNKRVAVLIEAISQLIDLTPAVHAVLIGDASDCYADELRRCRELASHLGVADRLHVLGQVDDDRLRDAYRSADVLVLPSRHEGFGIPVLEAMASGLPVLAARAAALPETVAGAGLTFTPDDPADLARQLRRVLGSECSVMGSSVVSQTNHSPLATHHPPKVAVVSFRYGTDFVGGAETSLRTIAESLHGAGCQVEVFTTCCNTEINWTDSLPEGDDEVNGVPVHRFHVDPYDPDRHSEAVAAVLRANGTVELEIEQEFLSQSIHSGGLLESLRQRLDQFDALIVGPYLIGLTYDIARNFPEKTLLLPCFHDEPYARLQLWRPVYEQVGGILYHSPEEKCLAEVGLGLNHPGAVCIGTKLDLQAGSADRGSERVSKGRYLVYCGRYCLEKNLPTLWDYARRYHEAHSERFTFAFLGQGVVSIPDEPWARDLGFVDESIKRDVLAGADALVQLSHYESLSIATLEAWAQGTPLLADRRCAVLAGQLARCQGGTPIEDYDSFAAALDDLWENPERWQAMGERGREYVRKNYGGSAQFAACLMEAVRSLQIPMAEKMRRQGPPRAAEHFRERWREQLDQLLEEVLDAPARPYRPQVEVQPRLRRRSVTPRLESVLIPVRVLNRGSHAVTADGPGRTVLHCRVADTDGRILGQAKTPLPALVQPGRGVPAAVAVPVPERLGSYQVSLWAERPEFPQEQPGPVVRLALDVQNEPGSTGPGCCGPLLEEVQAAMAEADRLQRLPEDYSDITEGHFARWKRAIKRKLLNNFKRAYVDVLSRQQSAFNRRVLTALHELAECCALLEQVRQPASRTLPAEPAGQGLLERLAASERRCAALEERLSRLEQAGAEAIGAGRTD